MKNISTGKGNISSKKMVNLPPLHGVATQSASQKVDNDSTYDKIDDAK